METNHIDTEKNVKETIVHSAHTQNSTGLNRVRNLSKNRTVQLGFMLLLIAAVPLTVLQSFTQQDVRQHASEKKFSDPAIIGSLPPFNDLIDLENQIVASHNGQQFTIQQSDYDKCPAAVAQTPGWWDPASKKNGNAAGVIDPNWYFGTVKDGTDPVKDPFYTTGKANVEARWAGDTRSPVASPHDRGIGYSEGEYIPGIQHVGGWSYEWNKDHACWGVSSYACSLNAQGIPQGGGRIGWSRAMGWATAATRNFMATKNNLPNRECVLAIAVMQTRQEWLRNLTESDSQVYKAASSVRNAEATGFYLNASTASVTTPVSEAGSGQLNAVNTPANDKNSCKDRTFSDIAATDIELQAAATCLAKQAYCTVRGFEDGTIGATTPLTRDYAVAFIARYHEYVLKDWTPVDLTKITTRYTDVPTNYGLALEIYTARENGFLSTSQSAFNPTDPWVFGFKGVNKADYDFNIPVAGMTRGDFIKALYTYGKASLSACDGSTSTAAKAPLLIDPPPFTEVASDNDNRVKVCGDKPSLLAGHITDQPSIRAFKDTLYVFAKGREDKLYVRALTTPITPSSLASNTWSEMGKAISGSIITLLQNQEGLPSLSVIVTGKTENKALISSTTGNTWSPWTANTLSQTNLMETIQVTSLKNMTYSFTKGIESSENNLCLLISAAPSVASLNVLPLGSGNKEAEATKPQTVQTSPASPNEATKVTLTGDYDTLQACKDVNPTWTTAECCSKKLNFSDGCPVPGVAEVTAAKPQPNLFQQFWSMITGLFK